MVKAIQIRIDQFTFDGWASGNPTDELVILLHGFPESAYMWRDLLEDISACGFYCIAPNLRGYSPGARPSRKSAYALDLLTQDVLDIASFAGRSKFHLIGHDWGAVIGWQVVHDHPEKILSWSALSIPHVQAFGEAVVRDPQQQRMSTYMKRFQWPFLPELGIRKNDFALFRSLWKNCSPAEIEHNLSLFREKGALTAALNYYRSNYQLLRAAAKRQILGDITVPTLFIWGEQDLAVGPAGVENGHRFMKGYYQFIPLPAGHWLVQTSYPEVSAAILEHLLRFKSSLRP